MPLAAQESMEHIGRTQAIKDHDHDLVHELSKQLDSVWRYDQYIANAEGKEELASFWKQMKRHSQSATEQLKELIGKEVQKGCF